MPTPADVDAITAACQDADVQKYTTLPSPYLRAHGEQFVSTAAERWEAGTNLDWALREDDELVGMVGLYRIGGGTGELGYWVARGARGRGLATEAAGAVVDWALGEAGLARVEWRAVVGNTASARAARSLGFHYEGMLRQGLANSFGRSDGWLAAVLATDDRSPQPWPPLGD
jgi:RimJ/RimL family protein N-acetyltransferase